MFRCTSRGCGSSATRAAVCLKPSRFRRHAEPRDNYLVGLGGVSNGRPQRNAFSSSAFTVDLPRWWLFGTTYVSSASCAILLTRAAHTSNTVASGVSAVPPHLPSSLRSRTKSGVNGGDVRTRPREPGGAWITILRSAKRGQVRQGQCDNGGRD